MRILVSLALVTSIASAQAPLTARLLPPSHGRLVFDVSDKADVAIYSQYLNHKPVLVYHSSASDGEHTVTQSAGPSLATWSDVQDASVGGRLWTTLILIASREPIDVRKLRDSAEFNRAVESPGSGVAVDSYVWRQPQ